MRLRMAWAPLALCLALSGPVGAIQYERDRVEDRVVVPAGGVLKVRLDETISSDRSRKGDRFMATVLGEEAGYDLPEGTRVEGLVTDVQQAAKDRPGMVDVEFRFARLPDGQRYRITGYPISLDEKSVKRTEDGRLVARASRSKDRTKFLAYGAGAGFLISTLTGGSSLEGALLGAAAGYLYGELNRKKANGREVVLKPGTEFGVRLDQRVAVLPSERYRTPRS